MCGTVLAFEAGESAKASLAPRAAFGAAHGGLREMLERTKHEARGMAGGKPPQSPQDARRVMAAEDGLRALAELEQAVDRIEREATPNESRSTDRPHSED